MTPFDIISILSSKEAIALYVAAAGIFVSVITYSYQKKEFRLRSLTEAFSRMNDAKHKEARKVVYGNRTLASFDILGIAKPVSTEESSSDDLLALSKDIARSDLNEVATLIRYNLLDKKIFISEYSWIIIEIWNRLESDILKRRTSYGPTNYMENFEELKEEAKKYVSKNHMKSPKN